MLTSSDDRSASFRFESQILKIEAWGPNALRIRATEERCLPAEDWALSETVPDLKAIIATNGTVTTITNGLIAAKVSARGKVTISNAEGKVLLEEFHRHRLDLLDPKCSALNISGREFTPQLGTDSYRLVARFESLDDEERIYGMGQYQQSFLNLKGADLELAQRNSQASVPFAVSSLGYGFLWNNPAIGRAVFGKNMTTFEARSTRVLDYWVVAGKDYKDIVRAYGGVTGKVPMMPEYGLGFWQCKLRYQTQDELLQVAREYKARKLPIDVIVVDFFHWPLQGEWMFDETFWPDPGRRVDAMIAELKSLGIELMVSVWPTVDRNSTNFLDMRARDLLVRQDRGWPISMEGEGNCIHYDPTNPAARQYVWEKVKKNYFDKGIRILWLDEAEPEYTIYDFDVYRYHLGPNLMIGNSYPVFYSRGFYEGMQAASGTDSIVNLVRCAWAGSQKYGTLLWSGDIASSWSSLRDQLAAGLNAGLAGISWWTTDIGGFHGGDPNDPAFRELFVRWFQWGAFCPVMRLHGDREPKQPRVGTTGGSHLLSGAPNEVWSYGDEVYGICQKYLSLREKMRSYVRSAMEDAHLYGDPVIRPLFYDFPQDPVAAKIGDEYMFGSKYLISPILGPGQVERSVYLPQGASWKQFSVEGEAKGEAMDGGRIVRIQAPLGYLPVFERQD
ncbi:hypothetical protein GQ53DRAFT_861876 [Thozetella sp. PMI_491]|nr:hypothetical protein GQ53DRAFT_861876 [Thozetella sp. PMI_491]